MAISDKIDLYKLHKDQYASPKTPTLVNIKQAKYLTIQGKGEPGGDVFQAKVQAMYSMAFTIKMTWKFAGKQDYKVNQLEGLWWCEQKGKEFYNTPRRKWCWKLLIRVPDFIKQAELKKAIKTLLDKGKPADVTEVKLEKLAEGKCVQVLHVGPYADEPATINLMRQFVNEQNLKFHNLHHEIYLSDPRRVPPERLRTILRQPVTKA